MIRYIIADDAPFIHELIKNILPDNQFQFLGSCFDGQEAIDGVSKLLPDVIFLDFVMPIMSGLDAAREIKQIWPEIKIIGMSTIDDERIISSAIRNGVDDFIEKPFTKDGIVDSLNKLGLKTESHQKKGNG